MFFRTFIQSRLFSKMLDEMIQKGVLTIEDYAELEKLLSQNPKAGEVIPGCSGTRKIRMKGFGEGKRGGFRVDYLDLPDVYKIHFIVLYKKSKKGDLSSKEKKMLNKLVKLIKEEEKKHG